VPITVKELKIEKYMRRSLPVLQEGSRSCSRTHCEDHQHIFDVEVANVWKEFVIREEFLGPHDAGSSYYKISSGT
jgi:hypothetical protein